MVIICKIKIIFKFRSKYQSIKGGLFKPCYNIIIFNVARYINCESTQGRTFGYMITIVLKYIISRHFTI